MIATFIKKLIANGWKQKDIAVICGITATYVSELKKGATCSAEVLLKIADAFNVTVDEVLGRKQTREITPEEELILKTIDGDRELARAVLRSAQGEKLVKKMEGEKGRGRKHTIAA